MSESVRAALIGSVALLILGPSAIRADESGATDSPFLGLVPDVFDDEPSELRAAIERYSTDLGSLRRSSPPDESPEAAAREPVLHRRGDDQRLLPDRRHDA